MFSEDSQLEHDDSMCDQLINEGIAAIEKFLMDFEPTGEPKATSSVLSIVRPIATFDKEFNELELSRLMEVSMAAESTIDMMNYSMAKRLIEFTDLDDWLRSEHHPAMFDNNANATMKFCKALGKFNEFPESDQMILFKNSCWKVSLLRNLLVFDYEKREWTFSFVRI